MEARPAWADAVLAFWFGELSPKDWWSASPALDARIAERFGARYRSLRDVPPQLAPLDARAHVALVIVYDQFARQLHRGSAHAFGTDPLALAVACDAIDRGLDAALERSERHFLYMPFMHSEDAAMQLRSIALFTALASAGPDQAQALRSAEDHRATIERFGRFPYRNAALGRHSTDEERAFLVEHPGPR